MNIDLAGKRALVTGSTSGIGRATAASFARAGAEWLRFFEVNVMSGARLAPTIIP